MSDALAFACLFLGSFTMAFSMPTGRALLIVALIALVIDRVRTRTRPFIPAVAICGVVFFGATLVASCRGLAPAYSLRQLDKLAWFLLIPVFATLVNSPGRIAAVLGAFAAGSGILALRLFRESAVVCGEALGAGKSGFGLDAFLRCLGRSPRPDDFWWHVMDGRDMTHPQMLMLGMIVAVGFVIVCRREHRSATAWWVLLALQLPALILQFKRGAWFCTALMLAALLIARWRPEHEGGRPWRRLWRALPPRARHAMPVMCAVLVLAVSFAPPVRHGLEHVAHKVMLKARTAKPGTRLTMWFVVTPALVKQHPNGIGWCVLDYWMMRRIYPDIEYRRTLHSNIAQVLVATGWAGLLAYVVWMGWAVLDAWTLTRLARGRPAPSDDIMAMCLLLMLTGLLLNGIVECNLRHGAVVLALCLIMGCAAGGRRALTLGLSGTNSDRSSPRLPER